MTTVTVLETSKEISASSINEAHKQARANAEMAVDWAITCGELLTAKKQELPHGEFGKWVEDNCTFSVREAQKYMAVNRKYVARDAIDFTSIRGALGYTSDKPHVANNTGDNEWYTPPEYLAAARAALDGIELDPATSNEAQSEVQASRFMTAEDDALSDAADWQAKTVWMNPPYAAGLIDKFVDRLVTSYEKGDVGEAIVLVNNATDTQWFDLLSQSASAVCFPVGRIRFQRPGGEAGAPLQGQALLYLGDNVSRFKESFSGFGNVWT